MNSAPLRDSVSTLSWYLPPRLAHRSAQKNVERYGYSLLYFMVERRDAQEVSVSIACPRPQGLEVAELGFRLGAVL